MNEERVQLCDDELKRVFRFLVLQTLASFISEYPITGRLLGNTINHPNTHTHPKRHNVLHWQDHSGTRGVLESRSRTRNTATFPEAGRLSSLWETKGGGQRENGVRGEHRDRGEIDRKRGGGQLCGTAVIHQSEGRWFSPGTCGLQHSTYHNQIDWKTVTETVLNWFKLFLKDREPHTSDIWCSPRHQYETSSVLCSMVQLAQIMANKNN